MKLQKMKEQSLSLVEKGWSSGLAEWIFLFAN
ncbi:hypothetical protein J2S78_002972 [Salibacterium salarium]|nr:hypothetical protein [Salibacterium salarium]